MLPAELEQCYLLVCKKPEVVSHPECNLLLDNLLLLQLLGGMRPSWQLCQHP